MQSTELQQLFDIRTNSQLINLPSITIQWSTVGNHLCPNKVVVFQFNVPCFRVDSKFWKEIKGNSIIERTNTTQYTFLEIPTSVTCNQGISSAVDEYFQAIKPEIEELCSDPVSADIRVICGNMNKDFSYEVIPGIDGTFPLTQELIDHKNTVRKNDCINDVELCLSTIRSKLIKKYQN